MLLSKEPFEASLHLLSFYLYQVVFELFEVGIEVKSEVVERLEVERVYALEEIVEERSACDLFEVVEGKGMTLCAPLGVGPS